MTASYPRRRPQGDGSLYQDGAGYAADYKELEGVERENLKRVGMLGKS